MAPEVLNDVSLTNPYLDECDLIASITKESFYDFVLEFWDSIVKEKFVDNWHIEFLASELQYIAERVFNNQSKEYDLIVNIPPGTTKSTLCSIMFPAWIWTRMPSARIIGASYAHPLSLDLAFKNRELVKSIKYSLCFPDIKLRDEQHAKHYFLNNHGGSRYSVGTEGSVTGMHGHFIIIDDPINPLAATSKAELKTANMWMDETLLTRKVDKAITPTILIMQRLHQNDPTQNMLDRSEKGRIKHICLPAELNADVKPRYLRERYNTSGLLDPVRLSAAVLKEYKLRGDFMYGSQFLQKPTSRETATFKVERIIIDKPINKWKEIVRYWDKAGSWDSGAYTVGLKMGLDRNNKIWILDIVRGQWDSGTRDSIIKQTARLDDSHPTQRVNWIGLEQEGGSGGKQSAEISVRDLRGYRVFLERPTGSKEVRADAFGAYVNNDMVRMVQAEWNSTYIEELRYFPDSTYKDQVDASSGAFNRLMRRKRRIGKF